MISAVAIIFIIIEYIANRNIRNIQLMHRCIDVFRKWSQGNDPKVNFEYLEMLNEELFYFQKGLIEKKVALEWIQGIIDTLQLFASDNTLLTDYNKQQNIKELALWKEKKYFFARIDYFIHTPIDKAYVVPSFDDPSHLFIKRQLAKQLYRHIRNYKF